MTDICPGSMLFWKNDTTGLCLLETVICVDENEIVVMCEDMKLSTYTRSGVYQQSGPAGMPASIVTSADVIIYP